MKHFLLATILLAGCLAVQAFAFDPSKTVKGMPGQMDAEQYLVVKEVPEDVRGTWWRVENCCTNNVVIEKDSFIEFSEANGEYRCQITKVQIGVHRPMKGRASDDNVVLTMDCKVAFPDNPIQHIKTKTQSVEFRHMGLNGEEAILLHGLQEDGFFKRGSDD